MGRRFAWRAAGATCALSAVLTTGCTLAAEPLGGTKAGFVLLLGLVSTVAWYGGVLPGMATTLLAALVGDYLLKPGAAGVLRADTIGLATFLVAGTLTSVLASRLRSVRDSRSRTQRARQQPAPSGQLEPELETLNRLGLALAGQLDIERLVKAVTDAGIAITGASFGAFIYRDGTDTPARHVAGAPPGAVSGFALFQDANAFAEPFLGAVARSDDLTSDQRFGQDLPFKRMPPGTPPARSYLTAPLRSRAGPLRGALFFGHPDTGFFHERDERLIAGLAAQAAIALDNAHLYREAREARATAEAANGLKDEFLATLSHELRTPLTAIVGWAHLLHRGQLSAAETTRAIDTIIRNAAAQKQIIDELLDVSRIITGKLQLDLQPVDIATIVTTAVATVTPAAGAKDIRLQLIHSPAGSHVLGDAERLQQVIWNLLSNAIKFTPKHGRVRVSVKCVGSNVEVDVADNGEGIDPAFLPRLFDRFSQNDASSTRHARGLGLGLAIARQLVELHGGSIQAQSAGLGLGATFTARFPRSPLAPTAAGPGVATAPAPGLRQDEWPDLTGVQVLVVEDDEDARGLIEKVLEAQGASVKTVASARQALDTIAREPVDVLVSDIEMPETDGYQLIRELRLRPAEQGGATPAVALTAYAGTEDRKRALRAGFQLHLAKPVQPSELVTVVGSLTARRR